MFGFKIVIVNHEKRLPVDTTLANLAIKHNMLYISVYQLIREHVLKNTPNGRKLTESRNQKVMNQNVKIADGVKDEF